jgi:hypothetical protein
MAASAWLGVAAGNPTDPPRTPDDSEVARAEGGVATADPFLETPRSRGTGLLVAGGVSTVGLAATRIVLGAWLIRDGICDTSKNIDACEENWSGFYAVAADGVTGGFVVSLGMLGAGLGRLGRWRAYEDLARGRPLRRSMQLRARLGWGLLGSGVAIWAGSIAAGLACHRTGHKTCFIAVHETGFYLGASLTGAGLGLAPFAAAYDREARNARRSQTLHVSPTLGRDSVGLSFAGRF